MFPVTNKLRNLDQQMFTGKWISVNQIQEQILDTWKTKPKAIKKDSISHAVLNHFSKEQCSETEVTPYLLLSRLLKIQSGF